MRILDRILLIFMSIMLVLMIGVITSYAYFQISETHGITISTGEFEVELLVAFDGTVITIDSPYYDKEKERIIVNAFDDLAENYIGNMTIDLVITTEVAARMRFKIQQEWELQRYYIIQDPENPIDPIIESVYHPAQTSAYYPYSLMQWATGFNTKYEQNGYIYDLDVIPKSDQTTINIIDGGDPYEVRSNDVIYEECYVYFKITIDLVQANRFVEVWGIPETYFD